MIGEIEHLGIGGTRPCKIRKTYAAILKYKWPLAKREIVESGTCGNPIFSASGENKLELLQALSDTSQQQSLLKNAVRHSYHFDVDDIHAEMQDW